MGVFKAGEEQVPLAMVDEIGLPLDALGDLLDLAFFDVDVGLVNVAPRLHGKDAGVF